MGMAEDGAGGGDEEKLVGEKAEGRGSGTHVIMDPLIL